MAVLPGAAGELLGGLASQVMKTTAPSGQSDQPAIGAPVFLGSLMGSTRSVEREPSGKGWLRDYEAV